MKRFFLPPPFLHHFLSPKAKIRIAVARVTVYIGCVLYRNALCNISRAARLLIRRTQTYFTVSCNSPFIRRSIGLDESSGIDQPSFRFAKYEKFILPFSSLNVNKRRPRVFSVESVTFCTLASYDVIIILTFNAVAVKNTVNQFYRQSVFSEKKTGRLFFFSPKTDQVLISQ